LESRILHHEKRGSLQVKSLRKKRSQFERWRVRIKEGVDYYRKEGERGSTRGINIES